MIISYNYMVFEMCCDVIMACSGHQFHKFSVRLLTHNSVAVVNDLLQYAAITAVLGRKTALERSETV